MIRPRLVDRTNNSTILEIDCADDTENYEYFDGEENPYKPKKKSNITINITANVAPKKKKCTSPVPVAPIDLFNRSPIAKCEICAQSIYEHKNAYQYDLNSNRQDEMKYMCEKCYLAHRRISQPDYDPSVGDYGGYYLGFDNKQSMTNKVTDSFTQVMTSESGTMTHFEGENRTSDNGIVSPINYTFHEELDNLYKVCLLTNAEPNNSVRSHEPIYGLDGRYYPGLKIRDEFKFDMKRLDDQGYNANKLNLTGSQDNRVNSPNPKLKITAFKNTTDEKLGISDTDQDKSLGLKPSANGLTATLSCTQFKAEIPVSRNTPDKSAGLVGEYEEKTNPNHRLYFDYLEEMDRGYESDFGEDNKRPPPPTITYSRASDYDDPYENFLDTHPSDSDSPEYDYRTGSIEEMGHYENDLLAETCDEILPVTKEVNDLLAETCEKILPVAKEVRKVCNNYMNEEKFKKNLEKRKIMESKKPYWDPRLKAVVLRCERGVERDKCVYYNHQQLVKGFYSIPSQYNANMSKLQRNDDIKNEFSHSMKLANSSLNTLAMNQRKIKQNSLQNYSNGILQVNNASLILRSKPSSLEESASTFGLEPARPILSAIGNILPYGQQDGESFNF